MCTLFCAGKSSGKNPIGYSEEIEMEPVIIEGRNHNLTMYQQDSYPAHHNPMQSNGTKGSTVSRWLSTIKDGMAIRPTDPYASWSAGEWRGRHETRRAAGSGNVADEQSRMPVATTTQTATNTKVCVNVFSASAAQRNSGTCFLLRWT